MAWTTPRTTWKTADLVNAAEMNTYLRDNLLCVNDHLAWSTWEPAVGVIGTTTVKLGVTPTQSGTYMRVGTTVDGIIHGSCLIKFSTDETVGNGVYTITLPLTMSSSDAARQQVLGGGAIYDKSGDDTVLVVAVQHSSAVCKLKYTSTGSTEGWVTHAAPWTWSSDDYIALNFCYERRK